MLFQRNDFSLIYLNRSHFDYIFFLKYIQLHSFNIRIGANAVNNTSHLQYNTKLNYINFSLILFFIYSTFFTLTSVVDNKVADRALYHLKGHRHLNTNQSYDFFSKLFTHFTPFFTNKHIPLLNQKTMLIFHSLNLFYNYRLSLRYPVFFSRYKGSLEIRWNHNLFYLILPCFIITK